MNRKEFLQISSLASLALTISPSVFARKKVSKKLIKIGIIADVHYDVMHDGQKRLDAFLQATTAFQPDAIVQMGDFAMPSENNMPFIKAYNKAHKHSLHILGNHDIDGGYKSQDCVKTFGMPLRYYAQSLKGVKFIVLDCNEKKPDYKSGYPSYLTDEQLKWLVQELNSAKEPVIIFSHQPLAGVDAIDNAEEIQNLLSNFSDRILTCLNGHTHIDAVSTIKGITYIHVNSASYKWVGSKYKHETYSKEIHQRKKQLAKTCPYKDSLYTLLTIDFEKGNLVMQGIKSEWIEPSPAYLGVEYTGITIGEEVVPEIRNRKLKGLLH